MHILTQRGHRFRVIYGYDRVTLWFDRSDLPLALRRLLRQHCRRLKVNVRQMKNNPLWKLKFRVFQPSPAFFRALLAGIGGVRVLITYVEIARDIEPFDAADLPLLESAFLACVTIPRLHLPPINDFMRACYFARAHKDGKKSRDVPVSYADKPSKQPIRGRAIRRKLGRADPRCLHVEWRRHGSAAIGEFGISSITDLLAFDFAAFFQQRMPFKKLPDSQTELGRMLPGKRKVNDDTLRKRARQFIASATLEKRRLFALHNAIRLAPPKFAAKLEPLSLEQMLSYAVAEGRRLH